MSDFTGIWLPEAVLSIPDLNLTEKVVLSQVLALTKTRDCDAKNDHFAERLKLSTTAISQCLKSLKDKGYVVIDPGQEIGNKRSLHPSVKTLQTLCKNLTEGNKEAVKFIRGLYKILTDPTQDSYRGYTITLQSLFKNLTDLSIYIGIENKEENKEENKTESNEDNATADAEVAATEFIEVQVLEKPPESTVPAAPSPDTKERFGDGMLQAECRTYYRQNPDKYPSDLYTEFLRYWTALVQVGTKAEVGKEYWKTMKTWSLPGRLSTWYKNTLKDEHNSGKRSIETSKTAYRNGSIGDRYGKTDYQGAFDLVDAMANAGHLNGHEPTDGEDAW